MSLAINRSVFGLLIVAALLSGASGSAHIVSAPGCESAQKLSDGTWLIRSPANFGRGGPVGSGAIVYNRTVVHGVDLGAVLDARCVQRYRVEPDYDSWLWAPNGFPTWVTPLP